MELGRVISPEAVREALDLAREEFFAANKLSRADAEKFVEATEFAPFSGAMLAGSRIVWACRDGGKPAIYVIQPDEVIREKIEAARRKK